MSKIVILLAPLILSMACPSFASQTRRGEIESRLEVFDLASGKRRVVHRDLNRFEAPNWTRDGRGLIFNQRGLLYGISVAGGKPVEIAEGIDQVF